jgi:putative transferase (TIGR04331 family)
MEDEKVKLLVSTAIEETWGDDDEIVFLGEWCKIYDRKAQWEKRIHETIAGHWDDRKKLKDDYDYLKKLHDDLLVELAKELNRYHALKQPLRYWQIILGPWIVSYLSVIWDRWETLRLAFEKYPQLAIIQIGDVTEPERSFDYYDYILRVVNDKWNYELFLEIIYSRYRDQCTIINSGKEKDGSAQLSSSKSVQKPSLKRRLKILLESSLAWVTRRNKVVFVSSYFTLPVLIKLNCALKQIPRLYEKEFEWPQALEEVKNSESKKQPITISLTPKNDYEHFLFGRIMKDIPVSYLTGFGSLLKIVQKISLQPKIILTANAHWGNEVFKVWTAEQVLRGIKFITMEHGGSIPALTVAMSFEEEIADLKTIWTSPFHKKHKQLPSGKTGIKLEYPRNYLGILGYEMPRYNFRAESSPKAGQVGRVHNTMLFDLFALLEPEVRDFFRIRPYPYGWLNTRQQFIDTLGDMVVSKEKDYQKFLGTCKLIVCTYPQTTFSESMVSGIPVILYYPAHLWETIPQMNQLLDLLTGASIVFTDAKKAAHHINTVWTNPEKWWNSSSTMEARNEFRRQALNMDDNWMNKWKEFIKEMVA